MEVRNVLKSEGKINTPLEFKATTTTAETTTNHLRVEMSASRQFATEKQLT